MTASEKENILYGFVRRIEVIRRNIGLSSLTSV